MKTLLEYTLPRAQPATGGRRTDSEPEVWLVHAIIGDGILTNVAAAKMLWAISGTGAFNAVRYFLLVGKCGTHQFRRTPKGVLAATGAMSAATGAIRFGASPNALCVHVSRVQDEAELRRLSSDPSSRAGLPRNVGDPDVCFYA